MTGARSSAATSLRAIGLPRPLLVACDVDQRPVTVTRPASRGSRHVPAHVEQIDEAWRVSEAWWRTGAQARTYYRVILNGGRPLTIFRDDTTDAWFEQPYAAPA